MKEKGKKERKRNEKIVFVNLHHSSSLYGNVSPKPTPSQEVFWNQNFCVKNAKSRVNNSKSSNASLRWSIRDMWSLWSEVFFFTRVTLKVEHLWTCCFFLQIRERFTRFKRTSWPWAPILYLRYWIRMITDRVCYWNTLHCTVQHITDIKYSKILTFTEK